MADQTRALFAGGYGGDNDAIDMVTIATEGNTTDFGDLTESKTNGGSCASSTRGIFAAGQNPGYNQYYRTYNNFNYRKCS